MCLFMCVCVCLCTRERGRKEREKDDERLGLNRISKFGMSSDQRTAMVEKERKRRKRRGNDTRATKLQSSLLPSISYSPLKFLVPFFYSTPTQGQILKCIFFSLFWSSVHTWKRWGFSHFKNGLQSGHLKMLALHLEHASPGNT